MKEISLREAMNVSMRASIDARVFVFSPEHLFLPFMRDFQVRIILAGVSVEHSVLSEMLLEYVNSRPVSKVPLVRPPELSPSFLKVMARLKEKNVRDPHGRHFLEAYAYCGLDEEWSDPESVVPSLLAQRHSRINLLVYGDLPGA